MRLMSFFFLIITRTSIGTRLKSEFKLIASRINIEASKITLKSSKVS